MSQPSRQPSRRQVLLRMLAIGTGLLASLVLVEVGLRIFRLAPIGGIATMNAREFARLPGLYVPGQRIVDDRIPALAHRITIDSLGYRGTEEFPRSKPADELRILMLGDSFTYGDLVNDDETLPALLQAILRQRCHAPIRTINAGVGGSSIETAAEMATRARPLAIDLAVLTFSENDVSDLAFPMWEQMQANRAAKSGFPLSLVYPILHRLAVWNLLLKAQGALRNARTTHALATDSAATAAPGQSESVVRALRVEYRRRLQALKDELAAAGTPLVLSIHPSHLTVYGMRSADQVEWLESVAGELGIPTVNYLDALQRDGRPMEELYLLPLDGHPSAAGYAVVVQALAEALVGTPELQPACGPPHAAILTQFGPEPASIN